MKNDEKRGDQGVISFKYYILGIYGTTPCRCKSRREIYPETSENKACSKLKNGLFVLVNQKIIFLQPYN